MWNECKDLQEYIVGLRRDLHQIPELGLHLPETAAYFSDGKDYEENVLAFVESPAERSPWTRVR